MHPYTQGQRVSVPGGTDAPGGDGDGAQPAAAAAAAQPKKRGRRKPTLKV